ncbi:MAG: TlpA disulfide reductase family protein [Rhodospirillaceae bacterium]|nr:TlpA disulfide reductase family protein [Rhodospirillaceae bacterium]
MLPRSRAGLIAAAVAVAAVLITALTLLASGPPKPAQTPEVRVVPAAPPATPPPAAAPAARPPMNVIRWHEQPKPAAQTVFQDGQGADQTLGAFKGKVLVVNFWATWCAPCIKEMPTLNALQEQLGGKDFQVLAISQDREGAVVAKPFLESNGWTRLALFVEPGARFAKDAQLRGLPTTLIIDKTGLEVGRLEGTIDWTAPDVIEAMTRLIAAPAN